MYAMFPIREIYNIPVLNELMLKLTINTFLFYIYFKACNINDIKTICCLE